MTNPARSSEREPLDLLIEQFLHLHRSGEVVTAKVFAEQHPEHQEQLLELLPTLLALEDVKRDRASSGSGQARVSLPNMERLGDFRIEGELGRGGMGVVFKAVQESLDRRVALKVLPQASLLTGNQLARFRREAQIAARLHHTNIVPVYGSGESDGYHWYAMQYLNGQSLDQWRATQSEMVPEGSGAWRNRARFVARIGVAAANALHYAHGMGTLHRDIKPGNFMVDQDGHLWVTDFGLAKALEAEGLTMSGDLVGTLQYMAPEQFAGTYDVRSEVYALGVTLYEMLTLAPAFRGRNRSELMEVVKAQRLEPLQRACPEVPADLAIIIGKAMAREPRDRYADAQALEQDLEAFLEDRPIQARPLSTVATTWRWCRRNRTAAALVASTAAGVLLAAIVGWVAYSVTGEALDRVTLSEARTKDALDKAIASEALANKERIRAENNLRNSLAANGYYFDALLGRDPALSFDEDPDTGEQTVVVHSALSEGDVVLLRQLLDFYDQFASDNAESQSLRYETARAYRRAGAIHSRLGEPDSLLEADAVFARALSGLLSITDRDVARDLATLYIDIAHLRQRQHQPGAANDSFRQALGLLEKLPSADTAKVRLERAEVLFELGRNNRDGMGRRGLASGPGGQGRGRRPREELQKAEQLLETLAAANPGDHKVQALQARVLMENAQHGDRQGEIDKALGIWRELVQAHPDTPEYRFQLCEALLSRRPEVVDGSPDHHDARLRLLQEAEASAEYLFQAQPLFREGRVMLLKVRARYGYELHQSMRGLVGDAAVARSKLALDTLQSAVAVGTSLVSGEDAGDFRLLRHVIEAMGWLGLHEDMCGNRAAAKQQAMAAIELGERGMIAEQNRWRAEVARMERGHGERGRRGGERAPDESSPDAAAVGKVPVGEDLRPDRSRPDGVRPDGVRPDGVRADGARPDGARPRGERPPRSGDPRRGPPADGWRGPGRGPRTAPEGRPEFVRNALAELIRRLADDEVNARWEQALARLKQEFTKPR